MNAQLVEINIWGYDLVHYICVGPSQDEMLLGIVFLRGS